MKQLTPEGQQIINNIAQRYNFSPDAVFSMLQSVINGNGSMAQFNHPEFGGSGQKIKSKGSDSIDFLFSLINVLL